MCVCVSHFWYTLSVLFISLLPKGQIRFKCGILIKGNIIQAYKLYQNDWYWGMFDFLKNIKNIGYLEISIFLLLLSRSIC